MDELISLASSLIEIPSHQDESEAGDFIEDWLTTETDALVARDSAGNVIARRGSGEETIALIGHHDVVPPADEQLDDTGDPRAWVEDGRLYGRGSADMKGAVAAMMLAFRDTTPDVELAFASFVGEEIGGKGAQHAVDDGFVPGYAIIGEGSARYASEDALDIVVAHRGRRGSMLHATGRACHASTPEEGINAIYRACEAIDQVREVERPSATVAGETLQGSIEATRIEAGTADNVIPDSCSVTLDERTLPGASIDLEAMVSDLDGIDVTIEQDWPPMQCHDEGFPQTVQSAMETVQPTPQLVTKPHATDASWLAEAGSATLVIGPAERGEAHTSTESVDLDLLNGARQAYEAIVEAGI